MREEEQMAEKWSPRERLEEEIRYMEGRLAEIGFEGDCAYERAMIRFFQQEIDSRRDRIANSDTDWLKPRSVKPLSAPAQERASV